MGLLRLVVLVCSLTYTLANTEINNFAAQENDFVNLPFTNAWPILHANSSTLQWNLTSAKSGFLSQDICPNLRKWHPDSENSILCPHELWVVLDLDESQWRSFEKFTLRVSWPAFFPMHISMNIYDPTSLITFADTSRPALPQTTRRKYARIRLSFSGVISPSASPVVADVPILLALEPLYFGVLPSSVLPTIWAIVAVIIFGIPAAMKFNTILQSMVQHAKQNKAGKVE